MTNEKKQIVLGIMRVEYSDRPVEKIMHEKNRKTLIGGTNLFGYIVTKSEITELFEMLIAERGQGECKQKTR